PEGPVTADVDSSQKNHERCGWVCGHLSAGVLHERQPRADGRAVIAGGDLEAPAKLLHALAHAGDAHADAASPAHDLLERAVRNAMAAIVDLQHQRLRVTPQPDPSGLAPRVPMNVEQRLLNDPEQR